MANALTDFTKKREFLVCMDSDGCVMDTVRIKHSTVMCPELIRVFALDDYAEFITAAWDEINLHTITRGISRFESVRLVFDRLKTAASRFPAARILPPGSIPPTSFLRPACSGSCKRQAAWPCANCRSGTMPATAASRPWSRRLSRSPV